MKVLVMMQLAGWLSEAKTEAVQVLDVRGFCEFADYFVLATGRSHQHVHSAASGVCWQVLFDLILLLQTC
jgi:ribosomal silencing factor RsfS